MNPPPDVVVCLDCGWSEFSVPHSWLAAGWLRKERVPAAPSVAAITATNFASATP